MREYEPKYPLEALDRVYYPNLLRDSNNIVMSENITSLVPAEKTNAKKVSTEIELRVRENCSNAEVAYHDSSGNRWIFLILKRNQSEPVLRRMQKIYAKLNKKMNKQYIKELA